MTTGEKSERKTASVGGELIIPVGGLLFAVYYLYSIRSLPWEAQINGFFISIVLLILAALFLVRTFGRLARGEVDLGFGPVVGKIVLFRKRIGLIVLTILFVNVLPVIGFTATVFLFLVAGMLLLGVRSPIRLFTISFCLSLGGYLLFVVALNSTLPRGAVERLLGAIF